MVDSPIAASQQLVEQVRGVVLQLFRHGHRSRRRSGVNDAFQRAEVRPAGVLVGEEERLVAVEGDDDVVIIRQQQLVDDLQLELPVAENTTYNRILDLEIAEIVHQAVELLPAQQKQVYLMSKEQELKREEIAKTLRISSETVKTHLARALRHIRAYSKLKLEIPISWLLFFLVN